MNLKPTRAKIIISFILGIVIGLIAGLKYIMGSHQITESGLVFQPTSFFIMAIPTILVIYIIWSLIQKKN